MEEKEKRQVEMHTDFFDRCRVAIDQGFYLEAILMEYAAIEARLEAICGIVGFPCGRSCDCRKDIRISDRIGCLRLLYNQNVELCSKTRLPEYFFTEKGKLKKWTDKRNRIVHGLFKDELKYKDRLTSNRELAKDGYEYSRLLYNETKRIRRLLKTKPELGLSVVIMCGNKTCKAYKEITKG